MPQAVTPLAASLERRAGALSQRLRLETKALHLRAERSTTMKRLLQGEMDEAAYCALLSNLLAIYSALEPAMERHAAHPVLALIFSPALHRAPSLRADLAALGCVDSCGDSCGDSSAAKAIVPATREHVERIEALDASDPQLLAAHAYVRYLGDLSGGQLLKRLVAQNTRLRQPAPVSFYDFGDTAATAALASAFRAGLGSMTLQAADEDAIVAEAVRVFESHIAMFDQLSRPADRELPGAR